MSNDQILELANKFSDPNKKEFYNSIQKLVSDYNTAVNELCLRCGNYREAHLGSCDGCRWKH